jgi:hypothetical protein
VVAADEPADEEEVEGLPLPHFDPIPLKEAMFVLLAATDSDAPPLRLLLLAAVAAFFSVNSIRGGKVPACNEQCFIIYQ